MLAASSLAGKVARYCLTGSDQPRVGEAARAGSGWAVQQESTATGAGWSCPRWPGSRPSSWKRWVPVPWAACAPKAWAHGARCGAGAAPGALVQSGQVPGCRGRQAADGMPLARGRAYALLGRRYRTR